MRWGITNVEKLALEIGYNVYSQFGVPLVDTMQKQQKIIEIQNDKISCLEPNNENLLVLLQAQQAQIESISQSLEALLSDANSEGYNR